MQLKNSFCLTFSIPLIGISYPLLGENLAPDVVLATPYNEEINLENYWVSEKLDGIRAIWTGKALVTRSGKIINAPSWFTSDLPDYWIEGELWSGRNGFSFVQKTVLDKFPLEKDWREIKFMLFDRPIDNRPFSKRYESLLSLSEAIDLPFLDVIEQKPVYSHEQLFEWQREVEQAGGEGLMLRAYEEGYSAGRSDSLLKLKSTQDMEVIVIGYKPGKGKFKGLVGALHVELPNGSQMFIGSGFTDEERAKPPGIGALVTIEYNGYTSSGLPRFARYLRQREPE